ncbi:hypothetical protein OH76DRAFT_1458396 [Lentinus brumalis]|uniref:CxC2-like cysteine cluster KDZ transposase-associated domain-containing protein n=1 Tax=Lentinus brumalis TaxID=2498619 RepID=A0A371CT42_9APHY|nr:hypothetical protein OH76DRAFT_1458396 [Polyporus brumalis]
MTAEREFLFVRSTKRADLPPERGLQPGALATLCPACPQPGINMDPRYESCGRPPGEEFLDALFHTADGNFQQNQKLKLSNPNDEPLTPGAAYYAHEHDFAKYQELRGKEKKEATSCHKFGVMGYGRYGGRVSGMVGLSCARHMFALPNSVVDLNVGEAYSYVDFAHLSGLQRWMQVLLHISAYDINCQYRINFATRVKKFREKFTGLLPSIKHTEFPRTLVGIGKFHLPAHIPACRFKHSFNYLPGVGMTDGEALEHIWSILNALAARAKEMTSGNRHDFLNDMYNDMNIRHLCGLARDLTKRYLQACTLSSKVDERLRKLESGLDAAALAEWKKLEQQWLVDVVDMKNHKQLDNPYKLKMDRGPTTKELLIEMEKTRSRRAGQADKVGILEAIYEGAELQSLREDLLDAIEDDDGAEDTRTLLTSARGEFLSRLCEWVTVFNAYIQLPLETAVREVLEQHQEAVEAAATSGITELNSGEQDDVPSTPATTPVNTATPPSSSPAPLLAAFPLRNMSLGANVTGREARANLGLPPLRNPKKKSEMWQEIYAISIPLPSSFDDLVLERPAVASLVSWEKKVREGQADDMLKIKKLDATGKSSTTRMGKKIRRQNDQVVAAADDYRRARLALTALGMNESDVLFRPLRKSDVRGFTMSTITQEIGQSRKGAFWIWEDFSFVERPGDIDHQEFYEEVKRVHWFRTSALRARWNKEVRLLAEEMTRCVCFFGFQQRVWDIKAHARDATGDRGAAAYARKQAHRYVRLLRNCRKHFGTTQLLISADLWNAAFGNQEWNGVLEDEKKGKR